MTELVLVRHGQASFGGANYDVLSPLGHRQSSVLGAHWKQIGFSADAFFSGAMARQKDTGKRALTDAGLADAISENVAFNEYDFEKILPGYLPIVAREHPQLLMNGSAPFKDKRQFQALFEIIIGYWLSGRATEGAPVESWADFSRRVTDGLHAVATREQKRVVVFTSGGVISVALREALKVTDEMAMQMNWRIANASVHRFKMGKNGLSLLGFNTITHLELANDPALITFR